MEKDLDLYKPPPCSVVFLKKERGRFASTVKPKYDVKPFLQSQYYLHCDGKDTFEVKKNLPLFKEKRKKSISLEEFLETANQNKFKSTEWINKWLSSMASFVELQDHEGRDIQGASPILSSSDDDLSSEVIWQGKWGGVPSHQEDVVDNDIPWHRRNAGKQNTFQQSRIPQGSIESMHEISSGTSNDKKTRTESFESSPESSKVDLGRFNVQKLFSESPGEMFVTLSCDNIMVESNKDRVDKRDIFVYHRQTSK